MCDHGTDQKCGLDLHFLESASRARRAVVCGNDPRAGSGPRCFHTTAVRNVFLQAASSRPLLPAT